MISSFERIAEAVGVELANRLIQQCPNLRVPGKRYLMRRRKAEFLEEYRALTDVPSIPTWAKKFGVSERTIYLWINRCHRERRDQCQVPSGRTTRGDQ